MGDLVTINILDKKKYSCEYLPEWIEHIHIPHRQTRFLKISTKPPKSGNATPKKSCYWMVNPSEYKYALIGTKEITSNSKTQFILDLVYLPSDDEDVDVNFDETNNLMSGVIQVN
jgi:hypothetical protein